MLVGNVAALLPENRNYGSFKGLDLKKTAT